MKFREFFKELSIFISSLESQMSKNCLFSIIYLKLSNYEKLTYNQEISDILFEHSIQLSATPLELMI